MAGFRCTGLPTQYDRQPVNEAMKTIRVILADDHTMVRAGIRELVERLPGVQVVAEAGDGREVLGLIRLHQPDLILMDIGMPGLNGLEATTRLLKEAPSVRVIVLTMHNNEEYVLQAMRAGASGFILKQAAVKELETAIQAVMQGDTYISPCLSGRLPGARSAETGAQASLLQRLTPRQREILQLIAESKTTKETAFLLNLSPKTVEFHRAELMDRLGIHDVPGLVRYAMQSGIIHPLD
jgi:DNA-binding NarL/FixJ family response regulator